MAVTDKQQEILSNLQSFMTDSPAGQEGVHKYMSTINNLIDRIKASYRLKFDKP